MNNLKVSISNGNTKMGSIPSVSLPACITCNPDAPCFKGCYAVKIAKRFETTNAAYHRNLDILNTDWNSYWEQVRRAVSMSRFFRFHVSGDIPDMNYLDRMVKLAEDLPGTTFLAFTKQYNFINNFLQYAKIPSNLKIIFSAQPGMPMENPNNLPVANVIFKGQEPADNWKICGGNCSECACRGVGCWELKKGEHIAFYEH